MRACTHRQAAATMSRNPRINACNTTAEPHVEMKWFGFNAPTETSASLYYHTIRTLPDKRHNRGCRCKWSCSDFTQALHHYSPTTYCMMMLNTIRGEGGGNQRGKKDEALFELTVRCSPASVSSRVRGGCRQDEACVSAGLCQATRCVPPSAAAAASCGPHGSAALLTSSPAAVRNQQRRRSPSVELMTHSARLCDAVFVARRCILSRATLLVAS